MHILRLKSDLLQRELNAALGGLSDLDAVAINKKAVKSLMEVKLAYYLTERAFEMKKNIARKITYEFLLWLSGKTDISSAIKSTAPEEKEDIILVVLGKSNRTKNLQHNLQYKNKFCKNTRNKNIIVAKKCINLLKAKKLPLGLKMDCIPLRLEEISLSVLER